MDYEVLANVSSRIPVIRSECTRLTALISVCALGQPVDAGGALPNIANGFTG
jgi:hypothetical protein